MIAIDTNVLVRLIVMDDKNQHKKAVAYIKNKELWLSHIVLCEMVWVLESAYDFPKKDILKVLEQLLQTKEIHLEDSDLAWHALRLFKENSADFADCLIGVLAKNSDCQKIATFDKTAAKLPGFELI